MYTFLAALPAILGFSGFVIFLFLKNRQGTDSITTLIVEKLRAQHPEKFKEHEKLTSSQLHSLLQKDQNLQREVGQQDFILLERTLKQQHTQSIMVYCLTATLFIIGIGLFFYQVNKPKPTKITDLQLQNNNAQSPDFLVDLEELKVTWNSSGEEEPLKIFLENADNGTKIKALNAISTDGAVTFSPNDYYPLLKKRHLGEKNRVRAIAQVEDGVFKSEPFNINVGATLIAIVFDDENRIKVGSMIDNSLISGYQFDFILNASKRNEIDFFTINSNVSGANDFPIENPDDFDWSSTKLLYLGPDDKRLFKSNVIYD